jgi:hypothetical protein
MRWGPLVDTRVATIPSCSQPRSHGLPRQVGRRTTALINARSNGKTLALAQMKEQRNRADVWDSYTVPWKGRFPEFVDDPAT